MLFLTILPFFSCANSNNTIPEIAFGIPTEIKKTAKPLDHTPWTILLQKHVSSNGVVDYKGFKKEAAALQSYLNVLATNLPQKSWTKNAILSYWINAYNAFTVQLILDHYPIKSIKRIDNPWDREFINLGVKKYSLGEIEHKILRKMNEPKIHFAINCASFSCPNLTNYAYTENELDKQLETAAKSFINDTTKNSVTTDKIEISSIFNWFSSDFKTNGTLIDYLNNYSSIKINKGAKVKYKEYNWNLNE